MLTFATLLLCVHFITSRRTKFFGPIATELIYDDYNNRVCLAYNPKFELKTNINLEIHTSFTALQIVSPAVISVSPDVIIFLVPAPHKTAGQSLRMWNDGGIKLLSSRLQLYSKLALVEAHPSRQRR